MSTNESGMYRIGMVGLGVMGRNLLLNIAAHGYPVAGLDIDQRKADDLTSRAEGRRLFATTDPEAFVRALAPPRSIILLVPPGAPVDAVLDQLRPMLHAGDLVIDSGNSHFLDTEERIDRYADGGIVFTGMGISGGEQGARHGASIMFGGTPELYERVRPMLEAVAADVGGDPCVARVGARSSGHYVKMVHNGIEYGVMQMIAECYDMMRRGLGFDAQRAAEVFDEWNSGSTASYLVEITAAVLRQIDGTTGRPLVDLILDRASQKGTGRWTSQDAMKHGVPITAIDAAVGARDLSAYYDQRQKAADVIIGPDPRIDAEPEDFLRSLREALYDTMVIIYAQGMSLLTVASRAYSFDLQLETIARIWRGGCIIRAALLERIRDVYRDGSDVVNPLVARALADEISNNQSDLRRVVGAAAVSGIPAPTMMSALAYFDGYRTRRLPANLIQAQRDFFGAHTYERIDEPGSFHTEWAAPEGSQLQPHMGPRQSADEQAATGIPPHGD